MKTETMQEILERPKTVIQKTETDTEITYFEKPVGDSKVKVNKVALQALLEKEPPFPRVVVRCDREAGLWKLFENDKPWKSMKSCVLINVSFSCEWVNGVSLGCGASSDGHHVGYAAGQLLPIATPLTVPTSGVTRLRFDVEDGKFYDPDTGFRLSGSGYLILKEGCSSEYISSQVIGAQKGTTKKVKNV